MDLVSQQLNWVINTPIDSMVCEQHYACENSVLPYNLWGPTHVNSSFEIFHTMLYNQTIYLLVPAVTAMHHSSVRSSFAPLHLTQTKGQFESFHSSMKLSNSQTWECSFTVWNERNEGKENKHHWLVNHATGRSWPAVIANNRWTGELSSTHVVLVSVRRLTFNYRQLTQQTANWPTTGEHQYRFNAGAQALHSQLATDVSLFYLAGYQHIAMADDCTTVLREKSTHAWK